MTATSPWESSKHSSAGHSCAREQHTYSTGNPKPRCFFFSFLRTVRERVPVFKVTIQVYHTNVHAVGRSVKHSFVTHSSDPSASHCSLRVQNQQLLDALIQLSVYSTVSGVGGSGDTKLRVPLATAPLYWRALLCICTLACCNPPGVGKKCWQAIPVVRLLMQVSPMGGLSPSHGLPIERTDLMVCCSDVADTHLLSASSACGAVAATAAKRIG